MPGKATRPLCPPWAIAMAVWLMTAGSAPFAAASAEPRLATSREIPRNPDLMAELFLGGVRGAYVFPNWSVADNWSATFGWWPPAIEPLGSLGRLLWSSRRHTAQEQGAMLLSNDRKTVRALAMLHFDCYGVWRKLPRRPTPQCTDDPLLSIFLRRTPGASKFAAAMSAWADRQEHHHVPYKIVWVPPRRP